MQGALIEFAVLALDISIVVISSSLLWLSSIHTISSAVVSSLLSFFNTLHRLSVPHHRIDLVADMTIGYLCTTTSPLISTLGLKCCLSGLGAAIHTGKSVIRAEEEEQEKRYSTQPSRLTSPPRVWLLSQHPMWRGHDRVALLCVWLLHFLGF